MQPWETAKDTTFSEWIQKPRLGIITDVDGTVSPIVERPEDAQVTPRNKALLQALTEVVTIVGVISGRAAADVQARVGVPGVVYVGNHGLERWRDGKVEAAPAAAQYRPQLITARDALLRFEQQFDGVQVEDKEVTLSIHYRRAQDPQAAAAALRPAITQASEAGGLRVFEGRMLFEVRPPIEMNKGSAFRSLVSEFNLDAALYMGDDTTDIDAIKAARDLREQGECYSFGLGVTAGLDDDGTPTPVSESSDFLIGGVAGVEAFLSWVLMARKAWSS